MKISLTLIFALALALMTGCQSSQNASTPRAEAEPEAVAEAEPAPPARERERRSPAQVTLAPENPETQVPNLRGIAEEESYGLTLMVDGTSPEAFQRSLEMIAEETTTEQYDRLNTAIQFLGIYDPVAWSGLPALYADLDGLTGEDIIERANEVGSMRGGHRQ